MVRSDQLVKAYLSVGGVGLACCFLMHQTGTGDTRTPITIEYSLGNPLASAFFASALVSAVLVAWLFYRGGAKAESSLFASVAICVGLLTVTPPDSPAHLLALLLAVSFVALAPAIYVLRSEFSLGSITLMAISLSVAFVVAISSLVPGGAMGLGIAERVWYTCGYYVNATVIKMMFEDGRFTAID